jgi:hypothetical protein
MNADVFLDVGIPLPLSKTRGVADCVDETIARASDPR